MTNLNPSHWSRRTKLEKALRFIAITSILMFFSITPAFGTDQRNTGSTVPCGDHSSSENLCLTPGCVTAASEILSNLNESVDPCTDFYQFACDGWIERHAIPEHSTPYYFLTQDINLQLKNLLEKKIDASDLPFIKMIKQLYSTCMDVDSIKEAGSEPLEKVLKNLGGWPVVEGAQWDESKFDWIQSLVSLRKLGFNHNILLRLSVSPDFKNKTINRITLDETRLSLYFRSSYLKHLDNGSIVVDYHYKYLADYFDKMVESAKLLGADKYTAENELLKVLNFEAALANISVTQGGKRDEIEFYNKYTVKQLQELVPQIPWLKYFNGLLNEEIDDEETVILIVPDFVKDFGKLITQTEKRVVANYILWRVIAQSLPILSEEFRKHKLFDIVFEKTTRWEECLSVLKPLKLALSSYYVRHYFEDESKDSISEIAKYIQEEFFKILEENDWMDEVTKERANEKANALAIQVGFMEEFLNNTAVMEIYENLAINSESYFENYFAMLKWKTDYDFSRLRKLNIRNDWKKYDATIIENEYDNDPWENNIVLSAGMLQNGYFNKDRPQYLNFGALGSLVGHQMIHAFDDKGRKYDNYGNEFDWWDETTEAQFKEKAKCMINQYSNYTVYESNKPLTLNGTFTLHEDVADNGGLKTAYRAYQAWVKDNGPEKLLPGVKYSQNQMFFISAANMMCHKHKEDDGFLEVSIAWVPYTIFKFRVIGPMSNLEEFSDAFNCSPDSPMNRKNKCQVW